jgi:hypothetical protein
MLVALGGWEAYLRILTRRWQVLYHPSSVLHLPAAKSLLPRVPRISENIASQRQFFAPIGDARVSAVDVRDIALVGAAALTQPGHIGKTPFITTIVVVVTAPSEVIKKTSIAGCAISPIRAESASNGRQRINET